jgi:hypothetical protein
MNARRIGIAIAAMAAIGLLGSCMGSRPDRDDTQGVELRTYVVPDGFDTRELRRYLSASLTSGETVLGTAVEYPNGMLAITAPPGVHQGVERLLADLERRGPGAANEAQDSKTLRYWAILGRPIDGQQGAIASSSPMLRATGPLRPVLDELTGTYGPMHFGLLEALGVTSVASGDNSSVRGRHMLVQQRVFPKPHTLADIQVQIFRVHGGVSHSVESRVRLEPGKFVVLAQSAYDPDGGLPVGWKPSDDTLLFLVIAEQAD